MKIKGCRNCKKVYWKEDWRGIHEVLYGILKERGIKEAKKIKMKETLCPNCR